jgi:hypothetical protein
LSGEEGRGVGRAIGGRHVKRRRLRVGALHRRASKSGRARWRRGQELLVAAVMSCALCWRGRHARLERRRCTMAVLGGGRARSSSGPGLWLTPPVWGTGKGCGALELCDGQGTDLCGRGGSWLKSCWRFRHFAGGGRLSRKNGGWRRMKRKVEGGREGGWVRGSRRRRVQSVMGGRWLSGARD